MSSGEEGALIEAAQAARERAYAPYSAYRVGSALQTRSGRIFTGCNVENASYGLTICSERVALGKAVSEGERDFEVLAICASGAPAPCGACRQVLHEFSPGLVLLLPSSVQGRLDGLLVGFDAFGRRILCPPAVAPDAPRFAGVLRRL